jgi:hypothetical protein
MKKLAGSVAIVIIFFALSKNCVGQTGLRSCTDNYEPNDTKRTSFLISTNQVYQAPLQTALDVDWFKFEVTALEPNIRIILFDLPKNYNIFLHDSTGKIGSSKNKTPLPDTIVANNLASETYAVKVRGKAGNFDPDNCYSLIIETSSTPFKATIAINDFVSADSQFELYPNPVSSKLFIECDNEKTSSVTFSIFNLMGQKISETRETMNENSTIAIDVNSLRAGEYLLEIRYDGGVEVKKFVVIK